MKHLANQNGRLDGVSGILLWSTKRARSCRPPFVDGGLGKPDREVAAPTQGIVVLGPVGHLVSWLGELVAAALAVFEGHLLFMSVKVDPHHAISAKWRQVSDLCNNASCTATPFKTRTTASGCAWEAGFRRTRKFCGSISPA